MQKIWQYVSPKNSLFDREEPDLKGPGDSAAFVSAAGTDVVMY
jgi:hypothetical protein